MSNELIGRIDKARQLPQQFAHTYDTLRDCKAEIERQQSELHKALFSNESLRAINFLQDERIKALEAKPVGELVMPSIDALIDELDALPHYSQLGSEDVMKALNKYRVGK